MKDNRRRMIMKVILHLSNSDVDVDLEVDIPENQYELLYEMTNNPDTEDVVLQSVDYKK